MGKNLRALILNTVQKSSGVSPSAILSSVNDADLNEHYIKNILYRACKEGVVRREGSSYYWKGNETLNQEVQEKADASQDVPKRKKEKINFADYDTAFDYSLALSGDSPYVAVNVAKEILSTTQLEQYHIERLGHIQEESKRHPLYTHILKIRVGRDLERFVRQQFHSRVPLSAQLVEGNNMWVDCPFENVLKNPPPLLLLKLGVTPKDLEIMKEKVIVPTFVESLEKEVEVKKQVKGQSLRKKILICLKDRPGSTLAGMVECIGDPTLTEKYVKYIMYRMIRDEKVVENAGTYKYFEKK